MKLGNTFNNLSLRITQSLNLNAIAPFRALLLGAALLFAANSGFSAQAATITVKTKVDGGMPDVPALCSLRDAIIAANTNRAVNGCDSGEPPPVVDTINFDIGAGTPTIRLTQMLPAITEPVIIRGDSNGASRVELDGSEASRIAAFLGLQAHGLFLVTGGSTIRNLVINRFNGDGIVLTTNSGGGATSFTPPPITDPSNPTPPTPPPCLDRPADPDCQPGGGGDPPYDQPIDGADAHNTIIGCFIGTDVTGTIALGNGSGLFTAGIVTTTDQHAIGGITAAERNVISGNNGHGIILGGSRHRVIGNFIGLDVKGSLPLGNLFDGVNVAGVFVGGVIGASLDSTGTPVCAGASSDRECGNRIAFNGRNGISGGPAYYLFLSNSIFSNGGLGIDVGQFGVTQNSPGSSRNFPLLSRNGASIRGTITNSQSQQVTIQLFFSPTCNPSGNGEGQEYIGSSIIPANGSFNFVMQMAGGVITVTSTTLRRSATSEFSSCLPF